MTQRVLVGMRKAAAPVALGRVVLRCVALALVLAGACLPAAAQQRTDFPAYTVPDVKVDRTAATAAAARDAALLEGQRVALRRLLERLTPRSEQRRLPNLSDARIGDLIENLEVQEERSSTVRYIASLTFRFRPDEIRTLLRNAGVPFAETVAKPYLVLPVLRREGLTLLWDDTNTWRAAWGRVPQNDGLAPLVLPRGDLGDISDINAEQALRGENARLRALVVRYGVNGVLVADATFDPSGARPALQVSVSRYSGIIPEQTIVESYTAAENEDEPALMLRAATSIARMLEDQWKNEQLLQFGREEKLTVAVGYDDVKDWVAIQRRFAELTMIRRSDVVSVTRHEAIVDLTYIGDENQLRLALAQRDLELAPVTVAGSSASWRISLVRAPAGRATRR